MSAIESVTNIGTGTQRMNQGIILVTGATGKTGCRVIDLLRERGVPCRAASRRADVRFDWEDASTWSAAAEGVEAVYLVLPDLGTPEATDRAARFARLLAESGSPRVVMVATPDDGTEFSIAVRATERAITAAGLRLTSLRLRWFHQNFSEDFLMPAVMSGTLRLPAGDGREAFVDADDIAAVAVAVLTDERHADSAYDLTGPRSMDFAEVADELTRAIGRDVSYVAVTPEQFVAEQSSHGTPIEWASLLCSLYQDIASGKLDAVSGDVEAVLGRPPRDFSAYAEDAARSGAWRVPPQT